MVIYTNCLISFVDEYIYQVQNKIYRDQKDWL